MQPMKTFVLALLMVGAPLAWGHASGNGHVHSVSLGDDTNGAMTGFGGAGSRPPSPIGGAMPPSYSPPPPPEPPPLFSAQTAPGTGAGVESKVRKLGRPGEALPRGSSRSDRVNGIYADSAE